VTAASSTGTQPLPNSSTGIALGERATATIGGIGSGNLISGNTTGIGFNVATSDPTGSTIQGNLIGTDATGTAALPNGTGIHVRLFNRTYPVRIGGAIPGQGNLISYNSGDGAYLNEAHQAVFHGNRIESNGGSGIRLGGNANGHTIGGIGAGEGNEIAWNATGVTVEGGTSNTARGNSIHDNVGKGIAAQGGTIPAPPFLFGGSIVWATTCGSCVVDGMRRATSSTPHR
jgi:hypothetical protein